MRIQVKGRNGATVDEELLSRLEKKLEKVGRQISPVAVVDVQLTEERNAPAPQSQVAEATLQLKGTTLRARESSADMGRSINLMVEDLASRGAEGRAAAERCLTRSGPAFQAGSESQGALLP